MQKSHTCTACGGKRQPGNKIYGSGYCICHPKKPNDIYVGNFLSVYRVRPENEGENSDDEDDKEDLVVSAGDLAQTRDTHVPVTEGDMKKGKWSLQRSLIVDAIESAKTHWKTRPCEPRALPNPCQGLDCNSVLKSVRRKTRPANCEGDSCVREPEVQQEIVNITEVKKMSTNGPGALPKTDATPNKQFAEKLQAKSCRRSRPKVLARAFAVGCAWRTRDRAAGCHGQGFEWRRHPPRVWFELARPWR